MSLGAGDESEACLSELRLSPTGVAVDGGGGVTVTVIILMAACCAHWNVLCTLHDTSYVPIWSNVTRLDLTCSGNSSLDHDVQSGAGKQETSHLSVSPTVTVRVSLTDWPDFVIFMSDVVTAAAIRHWSISPCVVWAVTLCVVGDGCTETVSDLLAACCAHWNVL